MRSQSFFLDHASGRRSQLSGSDPGLTSLWKAVGLNGHSQVYSAFQHDVVCCK